ncbi:MAG: oxidoreductase [Candidatus Helarchaeota archaeon]
MSVLFRPIKIGNIEIKNRIVRSATHIARNTVDGFVTDKKVEYFRELALGGVGLIIKGFTYISPDGRPFPLMSAIYDDKYIPDLRKLVEVVHSQNNGCKIAVQLSHAGREIGPGGYRDEVPMAPSSVIDPITRIVPRPMTVGEIHNIVESFSEGARRGYEVGFDAIQLHGAHGYLLNQFLSPHTNLRDDEYGGTLKNRCRIIEEIYQRITDKIPKNFPILIKMNATDFLEDGIRPDEAVEMAKIFEKIGFSALEISGGMWEAMMKFKKKAFPPEARKISDDPSEHAYHREHAKLIKKSVKIPIIVVGGIRFKSMAEDIIKSNDADLVSMSRPFICEPDLPNKWKNGITDRSLCISCNKCCDDAINSVIQGNAYPGIRCLMRKKIDKLNQNV